MRRSTAGTVAMLIAAGAAACTAPGGTSQPTLTPAASGAPSSSASAATPTATPLATLPAVPDGLPVMPGAVAVDPPSTEPAVIARWLADAIGPDVYAFYLEALPAAGFAIQERFPGGNVAVIRFGTPDGQTLDLALVGENDAQATRVSLRLPEGP
jgi:hypothetical protein